MAFGDLFSVVDSKASYHLTPSMVKGFPVNFLLTCFFLHPQWLLLWHPAFGDGQKLAHLLPATSGGSVCPLQASSVP